MRERWLFLTVLLLLGGGIAAALWVAEAGIAPGYALSSNTDDLDVLRDDVEALANEVSSALIALIERLDRLEAASRG